MGHLVATFFAVVAGAAIAAAGVFFWVKTIHGWQSTGDPAAGEPAWLVIGPLLTLICLALLARIAYGLLT